MSCKSFRWRSCSRQSTLAGKVLPERSGYYLGLRLVENYFTEHGAASTVRAAVEELRQADDRASGIQTA